MTDTTNTQPPFPEPDHTLDSGSMPFFREDQTRAYGDARAAHAVAQMQGEPVAVPSELRAIFDGLEFDAGAGRISAMALYARMRDLCLAYATPPVQQGPMGREGCNYMCKPGKVCRKCGHVHDIPLTAPPAPAAEKEADDAAQ